MNTYGYFDDENREYVITNPKTPVKWINYIGTLAFGGIVDQTGGALICKGDPALNRITKYIPQLPASEFKGETLYLRLRQAEGYLVFSPFYVPTLTPYARYECRVGLGYSRIISEMHGLRTEVTIFVPPGASCEVRDIRITNLTDTPLNVDAVPVVEYSHFDALKQFTNADWVPQTMQSEWDADLQVLSQFAFMNKETRVNYFTSNRPISSFESDRARFLGDHEYGTWANPLALQQEELDCYQARRGDNIGALLHHLGDIRPGQTVRLITQLGQVQNVRQARQDIEKYRQEAQIDQALEEMARYWDTYLGTIQVQTPNPDFNRMVNVYNPRQCHTTFNWSRYLSLYQLGLGARGMGFRDSSQDVMGVIPAMPQEAKGLLVKLLSVQKRDGSAMHQFYPLTMEANEGDSREMEDRPSYYSDDHLWAILAVCAYVQETGDLDFLAQEVPFYDKDKNDQPIESAPVLEHLKRGIAFTRGDLGRHGLPLLGFADWNDTGNLPTGAESVFTACLYGTALREMIALAKHLGDKDLAQDYQAAYEQMAQAVNREAWDGGWYIRYFDQDGQPLGSHRNRHGQIYTNAQSWAVISGFAPPERATTALDAVRRRLNTPKGIKLSTPGFNRYDPAIGGMTTYPPGAKENGGIFLHANPWVMIAETIVGRGDRAFEYYNQINPATKNSIIDEYECEPYVYAQNILGDEHPQFGLGRNSWLSGTASWCYQAATKYILGVRPTFDGLLLDPCIPAEWDGFTVTRRFRGSTYRIEVQNPDHVCRGIRSITLDGSPIEGQVLPVLNDGQTHHVVVRMG
ncbi:MAG: glycosyl transferase [Chloroflexi bacterium]|nr:MAG: glycosyl transferase [Chloroflexota bacterium]